MDNQIQNRFIFFITMRTVRYSNGDVYEEKIEVSAICRRCITKYTDLSDSDTKMLSDHVCPVKIVAQPEWWQQ